MIGTMEEWGEVNNDINQRRVFEGTSTFSEDEWTVETSKWQEK